MKLPAPDDTIIKPFGHSEEEAIVSLALDTPELFMRFVNILKPQMFKRIETQFVIANLLNYYHKYETIPTRGILKDIVSKELTTDDPYEEILATIDRPTNNREVPFVKETLLQWAKDKAYGLIYSDDARQAYSQGNYEFIETIVEDARKLLDTRHKITYVWDQFEELIHDDPADHYSTGWHKLDRELNGGPSPGEILVFMAATNVGKSIALANVTIASCMPRASVSGDSTLNGANTLLVSLEMSDKKIGRRGLGILTGINLKDLQNKIDTVRKHVADAKSRAGEFAIVELPPEETTVDSIEVVIDEIKRTRGWTPKVLVIDYLDLLISRNPAYNRDDYDRLKHVSSELRGLGIKTKSLIYTATQGNRGSVNQATVDLNSTAESYGKLMSLDYVVSMGQTPEMLQETPPLINFYIAKNRDGKKQVSITCDINYNNMRITEST